jgi:hypothetical protein
MPHRKIRTLAEEEEYSSPTMPSIERRSLMESGMRRKTTKLDMVIVVLFLLALAAILVYFLPGFLFGHR